MSAEAERSQLQVPWRRLDGKVIMVTGASSGLGREFAIDLAKAGCMVIAAARRTDRLKSLCDEIDRLSPPSLDSKLSKVRCVAIELDVTQDGASIDASIQKAWDAFGRIDALINNAGVREDYLHGILIGKKPFIPVLRKFLAKKWKLESSLDLVSLEDGSILFKFGSSEEKHKVLDSGPHFVAGHALALRPWRRGMSQGSSVFNSIPVWIQLSNLPLEFWSLDSPSRIGSTIGTPLFIDEHTANLTRMGYPRLCVEISPVFELPEEIFIQVEGGEPFKQQLRFEWKPKICISCKSFFHSSKTCTKRDLDPQDGPQDLVHKNNLEHQGGLLENGWTVVKPKNHRKRSSTVTGPRVEPSRRIPPIHNGEPGEIRQSNLPNPVLYGSTDMNVHPTNPPPAVAMEKENSQSILDLQNPDTPVSTAVEKRLSGEFEDEVPTNLENLVLDFALAIAQNLKAPNETSLVSLGMSSSDVAPNQTTCDPVSFLETSSLLEPISTSATKSTKPGKDAAPVTSPIAPCADLGVTFEPTPASSGSIIAVPLVVERIDSSTGIGTNPFTSAPGQMDKAKAIDNPSKQGSTRKSNRIRRPSTILTSMVGPSGRDLGPSESAVLAIKLKKSLIKEADRMDKDKASLFINWINSATEGELFEFAALGTNTMNWEPPNE